MATLFFEKISQFDRRAEPVTVSIPFGRGDLTSPAHLHVQDKRVRLPIQARPLAQWDDGSIKWLLVHLQPDLPGNASKTLTFFVDDTIPASEPVQEVTISATEGGLGVDTGPLTFTVSEQGFRPIEDVVLDGQPVAQRFDGFTIHCGDDMVRSADSRVQLSVEEAGPLRAVILVRGKHRRADGSEWLDLRGRITAYAGKPYIEVEHQFIHAEDAPELTVKAITLSMRGEAVGRPQLALGEGYYRTRIQQGQQALSQVIDAETLLYQANEHFIDSFYGDFWADWRNDTAGLTLSIHQAHQNFPKRLTVDRTGITAHLYSEDAPPARIIQGMGKTHRMQLHFHAADTSLDDLSVRSLQFQLPDRPSLDAAWYRANNPWLESFFPERLPGKLITYFGKLHDNRPKAMGMMHFGDAPDAHYTAQGRGNGEVVFVNNEYDRPHACTLFYALTGQRRVLDSALVSARHWLDVDFCHRHADPLIDGGLRIHTAYHATGGVTPSHEWTEGFLDYYFLTGRSEALDAANSIGENILRHLTRPEMRRPGATSVRENGWALRALVGLYLATGKQRWKDEAKRIVDMFVDWFDRFNALLAPYTSHTMPRVPFMVTLTVNSFARYLLIENDYRVKRLMVSVMDDLLKHCIGPDGIFYYKELPSLRRTAPTPHALEALTHVHRITGEDHYLKIAVRQFAALTDSPAEGAGNEKRLDASGALLVGSGGGRVFADKYTSILIFAGEAAARGMMEWYQYPFANEGNGG